VLFSLIACSGRQAEVLLKKQQEQEPDEILSGSEITTAYLDLITGKRVALVANHSTRIGNKHLVDSLLFLGVDIVKIFSPEHGFRGNLDASMTYDNTIDVKTGLQVISLYGKKRKPDSADLVGVDVVIFDIQDVGVRFYTYITTMHYVMEACADNGVELIILDRPNPNGWYVDGPILDLKYRSFLGMHPIPLVHGMTIAELAGMINGEGWLRDNLRCNMKLVTCKNYTHNSRYKLEVKPSPNLQSMRAVYLYPSLGLFEGTVVSLGRGTDFPFEVYGNPEFQTEFSYVPVSKPGAALNPKHKNKKCYGYDLRKIPIDSLKNISSINLRLLIEAYHQYPDKEHFFNRNFNFHSGNDILQQQVIKGFTGEAIKETWQKGLDGFKKKRKKYLLYEDFE
jgi:uncharacterized protein YbbC (DUF1343 family)